MTYSIIKLHIKVYNYILKYKIISAGPSLEGHTAAGIESRSCSLLLN